MRVAGEPAGRSEVGEDDKEDDKDDGKDGMDDKVEVEGAYCSCEAVMVLDRSLLLAIEVNCPRCQGWDSQCLVLVGASLSLYTVGHKASTLRRVTLQSS